MNSEEDPGWRAALRHGLIGLIPGWSVLIRKRSSGDGLVLLRGLLLTFSIAILLVGVVVLVLETSAEPFGSAPELPATLFVMATGAATLVLPPFLVRPLSCDSDDELSKGYVQRFFLRIAFAELRPS